MFTLKENCLMGIINVICGSLLCLESISSYLSKISLPVFYFFHCSIPVFSHSVHFAYDASVFSVQRTQTLWLPYKLFSIKKTTMSLLGLEPLVQLLWTCALWQQVELMPIMKWGFTAGIWQGLESLLLKQVECC